MTAPTLNPTGNTGRINSIDTIRGVALLGILLMNITDFGLTTHSYFDPTVEGNATAMNIKVWWINAMFFEGTMRGMFSMLFGAGIIIFTSRNVQTPEGPSVTDLYFRRLMWLLLFGVINCYVLLWHGDILYAYALVGMIAFSFRQWQVKHLIIGATVLLLIATALSVKDYLADKDAFDSAHIASAKKQKKEKLEKADEDALAAWNRKVEGRKPPKALIDEKVKKNQQGYWSVFWYKAPLNQYMETVIMYRIFFWDVFAMMLLGMAFFKNGIFKLEKSTRFYIVMGLIGYTIGLITNYLESEHLIAGNFGVMEESLTGISYSVGRVSMTLGHIAWICLFIRSGMLMFLQKALAAVGQMAFTNYIMQSIICSTIFIGFGFGLFGMLERYQLYYIVFGVWVFQLIFSPIWLQYFRFGPLEWLWRSLTYWKRQPFVKELTTASIVASN